MSHYDISDQSQRLRLQVGTEQGSPETVAHLVLVVDAGQ